MATRIRPGKCVSITNNDVRRTQSSISAAFEHQITADTESISHVDNLGRTPSLVGMYRVAFVYVTQEGTISISMPTTFKKATFSLPPTFDLYKISLNAINSMKSIIVPIRAVT